MPDTVNQKISELPAATSPGNNDVLAGVQSSTTKKFTLSLLKTFFQSGLTKSSVGLGNVDNTSDANKPVSTAQQAAIDGRVPITRTVNGKALSADIVLDAVGSITLSLSWSGSGPYTQTVTVTDATVTSNSKVDLQPTPAQIAQLIADGVEALVVENNAGTLTATAIGAVPSVALTVQCTVTEVVA